MVALLSALSVALFAFGVVNWYFWRDRRPAWVPAFLVARADAPLWAALGLSAVAQGLFLMGMA